MSVCAKFQLSSSSRSASKVCVGGGVGWFAKSFLCQTQPLCCVEVRVGVLITEHIPVSKADYVV